VKLPLGTGVLALFDVPIPAGTYNRLAVRVHKPNHTNSGPNVETFLTAHPEWLNRARWSTAPSMGSRSNWSHDPSIQLNHTFDRRSRSRLTDRTSRSAST